MSSAGSRRWASRSSPASTATRWAAAASLPWPATLRLASESARLGQPEIKLGLIPGYGGTQRLPRLVGQGAALKMLLTGAMVDAAEALRIRAGRRGRSPETPSSLWRGRPSLQR